ncbi:hypothetical protein FIBSPDRAFT_388535 [Athelia psychrophila]|uniref:Uncharacterized protein n=1 Tax=Athelia psychrophila TaxID=1759441 RepID=A0A166NTD3_9AGAM|nr:hypothetical protein FIBSPDRAFT_388535 [Fibularhizoctonia sp. CBS 109695]
MAPSSWLRTVRTVSDRRAPLNRTTLVRTQASSLRSAQRSVLIICIRISQVDCHSSDQVKYLLCTIINIAPHSSRGFLWAFWLSTSELAIVSYIFIFGTVNPWPRCHTRSLADPSSSVVFINKANAACFGGACRRHGRH